jgi:3-hydroxyisobutyrate dehydrogenase-like beta-hydroxyacid dehydrogenase
MEKKTIGFVGLGLMGNAMAGNLLSAGFPLIGYDIDQSLVDAITEMGGKGVDAPEHLPEQADVIILSLPNSYVVDDVVKRSLRLFETGRKGLILIDTTTADPIMSEALAIGLREKGIEMLDATVSGSRRVCLQREVLFMVGGNKKTFRECEPIFSALAKPRPYYLGKNGSGARVKLIVNLVGSLNRMVLAEGLSLGKRAGMDQRQLLEILKNSHAYSKAMDAKGNKMIEKDFLPAEGKVTNDLKDFRLILDFASRLNFPLLISSLFAQACASEVAKGRCERDVASIICFYEDLASI